jgi:hypothetical protein
VPIYTLGLWAFSNKQPNDEQLETQKPERKADEYECFVNDLDSILDKTNFSPMSMPDQFTYDTHSNDSLISYLAIKKWKPVFYRKQTQIDEDKFYNTTMGADEVPLSADSNLSAVNLNTKQKAKLDAINSLKLSSNDAENKLGKLL